MSLSSESCEATPFRKAKSESCEATPFREAKPEESLIQYIINDIDHVSSLDTPPATIWLVVSTPFVGHLRTLIVKDVQKARNVRLEFISPTEINIYLGSTTTKSSLAPPDSYVAL